MKTVENKSANNQLVVLIQESGLEKSKASNMLNTFQGFFMSASEWERKSELCRVTSREQKTEMKMAREGRLYLKNIRVEVEKRRKELKEQSLREGKAIDGIANVLKSLIVPLEKKLESYEKFEELEDARIAEEKRIEAERISVERMKLLEPFGVDTSCYNLGEMADDVFANLYDMSKKSYEDKIEAERKAETERIERERKDAEDRENQRIENERLKKEAIERERIIEAERRKAEKEKRAIEAKAEAKRLEAEKQIKMERERQEAIIRKEREEREKLEAELRAKAEAERLEAERLAEQIRKAKAAPDKEKLKILATTIASIEIPSVDSDEAKDVIESVKVLLSKVDTYIKDKIELL